MMLEMILIMEEDNCEHEDWARRVTKLGSEAGDLMMLMMILEDDDREG